MKGNHFTRFLFCLLVIATAPLSIPVLALIWGANFFLGVDLTGTCD